MRKSRAPARYDRAMTGSSAPLSQRITCVLLGVFMAVAGIAHLTFARTEFAALVPTWLPLDPAAVVVSSGLVELAFAAALLCWRSQRRAVCICLAGFFLVVWLGNIDQYVNATAAFGLQSDAARATRMALQPLLIAGALWGGGVITSGNPSPEKQQL